MFAVVLRTGVFRRPVQGIQLHREGGADGKPTGTRPADGMAEAEGADGRAGGKLGIIGWGG